MNKSKIVITKYFILTFTCRKKDGADKMDEEKPDEDREARPRTSMILIGICRMRNFVLSSLNALMYPYRERTTPGWLKVYITSNYAEIFLVEDDTSTVEEVVQCEESNKGKSTIDRTPSGKGAHQHIHGYLYRPQSYF